ncbi:MAG TPA: hypothetical protein VN643_13250 [Pyrinomonadaceae bacterium]|nr:hypothetical protein [Pyrinomonadaceae bacterium]
MASVERRKFLSLLSGSVAVCAATPLTALHRLLPTKQPSSYSGLATGPCWLDVCAPFVVEDNQHGIHTDIVLTSDTFAGVRGYEDNSFGTNYEIYLYDAAGKPVGGADGVARRVSVPAMRTTTIGARELVGERKSFWGGMKVRIQPYGAEPMHASDLFSSAFLRWQTESSFDNVHANPDPLQWQTSDSFFYSMPFPPLGEYRCTFSLFNPYAVKSAGAITLCDRNGVKVIDKRYELAAFSSLLLCLNSGTFGCDAADVFVKSGTKSSTSAETKSLEAGGMLSVTNDSGSMKSFGYLLIKQLDRRRFSVEHPIHQNVFVPAAEVSPLDQSGNFKAKNVLYSPLLFSGKKLGGISFESRCFLSTGLPLEQVQWFYPFATGPDGSVQWQAKTDARVLEMLASSQFEKGLIKLPSRQSCMLDFAKASIPRNFSGGLSLAVSPDTTHTLTKIEIRVPEWGAHAFTHFRPGLQSARGYQKPKQRGGLATDYVTSGARLEFSGSSPLSDELIGIMNIDDRGVEGQPTLEVFGASGLITRVPLGIVPSYASRHYLLSELVPKLGKTGLLTLRLVDAQATLLMSIVHIDYVRRDIALDHGSDRFSTLNDYNCNPTVKKQA